GVMFTPQSPRPYGLFFQTQKWWAAVFVVPIAIFVALVSFSFKDSATVAPRGGDLLPLATSVFRDFAFPFEVASVLLLAAMVGAIVLVKRDEE
ncbi:MAG TPA: NADH-quinone oxidoreductase subunit J, partial [Candidatus Limnocylindria bacterium]